MIADLKYPLTPQSHADYNTLSLIWMDRMGGLEAKSKLSIPKEWRRTTDVEAGATMDFVKGAPVCAGVRRLE